MFNELLKNVMNLGIITEDDVKRLTAIELMMLILERTNGLLNHVEIIDAKLVNLLENIRTTTIEELNKWKEDGTFDVLINQSALKKVNDRIDENVKKISERFSQTRKFKPKFGVAPWWNDDQSHSKIDSDIIEFKKCGCEYVDIIVYVQYSETSGFYTVHTLESQLYAYYKIIENGMKVNKIKFHQPTLRANAAYAHWDEYAEFMKKEVEKWSTAFEDKGIEYFTVLNEWKALFNDKSKEAFIIELINIAKKHGFKCGISNSWIDEAIKLSDSIKASVDFFCCNVYPRVSYNKQGATFEESVKAWEFYETQLKYLKSFGKPIMISETGTPDKWEALANPTDYTLDVDGTPANGKASEIVLYGIFNSKLQEYVESVTWWYFKSIQNEPCRKMIHDYLGMGMTE